MCAEKSLTSLEVLCCVDFRPLPGAVKLEMMTLKITLPESMLALYDPPHNQHPHRSRSERYRLANIPVLLNASLPLGIMGQS